MSRVFHGIMQGNTIVLREPAGATDGQEVEVELRFCRPARRWGEGIRASAGGWADYPEMDAIMEKVQQNRKRGRRPPV